MRAITLCSLLLVSACATVRAPDTSHSRPLVPPSALTERTATQIVHGAFGEREVTLNCVLKVSGDTVTVIGLNALGARMFTLRFDGKKIEVDHDVPVPSQLTPERLLADIQLVYWPLEVLATTLERAGWRLTEPYQGTRRLQRGGTLIAEIHYQNADPWQGRSWLVNLEHHYTLGIESEPMTR